MCVCVAIARQDGTPIKLSLLPHLPYAWWQHEKQVQLSRAMLLGLHPSLALNPDRRTHSALGLQQAGQVLSTFSSYITELLPL